MKIELPTSPGKVLTNARRMLLYSHTKVGKTTALSKLSNVLLIDLEEGSDFVECLKIDAIKTIREMKSNPLEFFISLGNSLQEYYNTHGKFPYDYLAVDTTTALEKFARVYATILYKQTPIGKSFTGQDVVAELPNGAGYDWLRKAFEKLLEPIMDKCNKCIILASHVKDSSINKDGKDLAARDIALTGKLKLIVSADADAIGYLYRSKDGKTMISFKTSEQDLATGARPEHLANNEFTLLEKTPDGFVAHWDKIFV